MVPHVEHVTGFDLRQVAHIIAYLQYLTDALRSDKCHRAGGQVDCGHLGMKRKGL